MATTASPAAPVSTHEGVPPLRAGQGHSFLLRRLHSLSGIIPVGAFLVEHFVSNAFATRGPGAYAKQVELLSSFPFVFYLELFGIWLPILYHALYGFYIWFRGESNVTRLSLGRQLDVHAAALDRRHRLLLHRVAHLAPALQRRAHPDSSRRRLRQGASWNSSTPGPSRFTSWEFSAPPGTSPTACGCSPPSGESPPATRPGAGSATSASPSDCCSSRWERSPCARS